MEAGTQFIGVKPGINMQERKSNVANNPTDVFTIEDIRGYNSYVGFISTEVVTIENEDLVEGNTYIIKDNSGSGDFTNVGAADNLDGTYFTATGTTPTDWGHPSAVLISVDDSVVSVNEVFNSLGITPDFQIDLITYYPDVTVGFDLTDLDYNDFVTNVPRYTDGYVYSRNDDVYSVTVVCDKTISKQPIQVTIY